MMMFKKFAFVFLMGCSFLWGYAQEAKLSPLSKLSLLTVGTGQELASKFGHSAVRLQDPTLGIDVVYGYGTYNFEDPNFYLNFTRGKLNYTITRNPFNQFKQSYIFEQRWIKEQELDLSLAQRETIITFLETNLRPKNRWYKYDFLFENCATKIPEVFEKNLGDDLQFSFEHLAEQHTFRELIHQSLSVNSWATFGIDLALGSVIDKKATPYEHMFLPVYVYKQLKHTTINDTPLVHQERVILDIPTPKDRILFLLSPAFWLGLLLLAVGYLTYTDLKHNKRTRWVDIILFSLTGAAGLVILFLWFFTDHNATKGNYNIIWALATNLIAAFYAAKIKTPKWLTTYVSIALGLLVVGVFLWLLKVQLFSPLLVFILLALAFRYGFLLHHFKKTT